MTVAPIIDAQIHVWKASTSKRPWPADAITPHRDPLEIPEVRELMMSAGVTGALLLAPTWEGSRNDYVLETAAADPSRFGALLRHDVSDPEAAAGLVDWRSVEGMRGIRMSLNRGDVEGAVRRATTSGFFANSEAYGVPLSIYAPGRYDLYESLAVEFPALKITVDHAALEHRGASLAEAIAPLQALAAHPGIAVKASALPCFIDERYPFASITEAVYRLVEWFGAERVFWGSDLSRLPVPYDELVDVFVNHTPQLSDDERDLVLGSALADWLEWPHAAATTST
ncbi:MAG: amidohydrolase [Subtercola sp.]|nr:amidohydrolase [Subtercola sp.]